MTVQASSSLKSWCEKCVAEARWKHNTYVDLCYVITGRQTSVATFIDVTYGEANKIQSHIMVISFFRYLLEF